MPKPSIDLQLNQATVSTKENRLINELHPKS